MRTSFRLLPLLTMIAMQPVGAIVLSTENYGAQGGAQAPAAAPVAPPPTTEPVATPTPPPTGAQVQPTPPPTGAQVQPQAPGQPSANLANIPKGVQPSPEQLRALSGTLNQQQLEAVAKAYQAQVSATTPAPQESFQPPPPVAHAKPTTGPETEIREKSPEELKNEAAFNMLLNEALPLSPEQIMKLHRFYDLVLQARAAAPVAPPNPQLGSIRINLEPGSAPPVIRLSAGFVSTLLFLDSTGSAWPIVAYSIGDPQTFNIQWDQKGNALFIQSLKPYAHGNLAVRLHHLDTPVMLTLVSGQRNVDFRVDLQVPGRGPAAIAPVVETVINAKTNPLLMNLLDGVPPIGSIKLEIIGGPGDAWLFDDKIFFRTKLTVLSPAWLGKVTSLDGTNVYEMMITPYIMATHEGKTVNIKISGL